MGRTNYGDFSRRQTVPTAHPTSTCGLKSFPGARLARARLACARRGPSCLLASGLLADYWLGDGAVELSKARDLGERPRHPRPGKPGLDTRDLGLGLDTRDLNEPGLDTRDPGPGELGLDTRDLGERDTRASPASTPATWARRRGGDIWETRAGVPSSLLGSHTGIAAATRYRWS